MNDSFVSAPARPVRAASTALIATMALLVFGAPALAQQPAPKEPAPKAAPAQPKAPQPKAPTAQPKGPPAPAAPLQAAAPPGQPPQLTYSPWTKFCPKQPDANAKQVCITAKDGRLEDGRIAVSAALIEPEGEQRKILKVMLLPLGLQVSPGTRVVIDQGQPMSGPYAACFLNGCFADYEASADLIAQMKEGQNLIIQGMGVNNQVISLPVPLKDFAKAHDGPSLDPEAFEELQKKLQEELERKARKLQVKSAPPVTGKTQ